MNSTSDEENKLQLIVTGASRGFGRACALAFCRQQRETALARRRRRQGTQHDTTTNDQQQAVAIHAVLVGRSPEGLQETAAQLLSLSSSGGGGDKITITTHVVIADLGDLETLDESIDRILQPGTTMGAASTSDDFYFDESVLINNAGSLGHIGSATTAPSLNDMRQTVDLNVTAALWLSVRVARWASERRQRSLLKSCTIVNVSSLVAVQPFPTLAIYSAGKAARDAYHNSMAQDDENDEAERTASSTKIRILNYAPGPLEATEMTQTLREADDLHSSLKPQYRKTLVDVNDSAMALMQLLHSGKFDNGQHVDFYDLVPPSDSDTNDNK